MAGSVRTYDIINAGPKNRFMAAGVIVSNSGRRFQPQNLRRPEEHDIDTLIDVVATGDYEFVQMMFGEPLSAVADILRGLIVAGPGHRIMAADYSNIEGRVLAWLAGEAWKMDAFREFDAGRGHDLYKLTAGSILGKKPEDITKDERQSYGKVPELACIAEGELVFTDQGFVPIENVQPNHRLWDGVEWVSHGGVVSRGEKLVQYYDGLTATVDHIVWVEGQRQPVSFAEAITKRLRLKRSGFLCPTHPSAPYRTRVYDILNAGPRNRFTASGRLVHNCGYQGGYGAFVTMGANYGVDLPEDRVREIVSGWREAHPNVKQFWYDMEGAAVAAVQDPGTTHYAGRIRFKVSGSFLAMRLPSGRHLFYPYPEVRSFEVPWTNKDGSQAFKDGLTYFSTIDVSKKAKMVDDPRNTTLWGRIKTYGGMLAENATQAAARDILADAMPRLEAAGYPIILTVHDEIVCEVPNGHGSVEEMERIMCELPEWAAGLPVAAEGFEGERYRK